jgi:DNA-binding PadR family transcriptional regulator
MQLKSAEFLILAVLCDGELHSNGIQQAVYRKTNGGLVLRSMGLFRSIRTLTNQGLIETVKKPVGHPGRTGQRAHYSITELGREVVQREADARAEGR